MDAPTDILIAGGGVAGLTAAALFGTAGFTVTCVDPAPPVTDAGAPGADLRTTAFLQPARALLEQAGLWPHLARHATPLEIMRIVDAAGPSPVSADFVAQEIGDMPFGWNLPNWLLRREILARLAALPNVTFRPGTGFARMLTREGEVITTLSDDTRIRARLLIAADGRDSAVRQAAGIGARSLRYGQKAVVFAVTHDTPHDSISTEVHRAGGPFTLVPLPDHDGRACSSVVWMLPGPDALALMQLSAEDFAIAATERSAGVMGPLTLTGKRQIWPIIGRIADSITAQRVALVAEAAHVVPPIGAQGLNMSLADIGCLHALATARPEGLGDRKMLDNYSRQRLGDIRLRVAGIDALNRASIAGAPMMQAARGLGLRMIHGARPVRNGLMRLGLGAN